MGFLGSLVGGYAETMLKKQDAEREQENLNKRERVQILQHALDSGKLTPEAQKAAWEQLEEITGGGKGKGGKGGKGKFSITDIMGRLTGHIAKQSMGSIEGVPETQQAPAQGGSKKSMGSPPTPPTRSATPATSPQEGAGASMGQPPQPPQRSQSPFKTQEQLNQEAVDAQTKVLEAERTLKKKWRAEDAVEATEAMNKAKTPEEKAIVEAEYGIKMPPQHFQYATVKMPDGSLRPAGYDPQTNQYLEPGTNLVLEGAIKYTKPATGEEKKEGLINSYMAATGKNREEAEKWFAKQDVRIEEAKGAPTTSTSTSVESTPGGPAITKETVTTRGPAGSVKPNIVQADRSTEAPTGSGPKVDTGIMPDGSVKGAATIKQGSILSLPWALPKEARVAIRKATDQYESAKTRYELMRDTEAKIKKDPKYAGQGDVVLLFNHVALARGDNSSIRPTQTMIDEAKKNRTLPEGIQVTYTHNFVSGASLSPAQRRYMVETAAASTRAQQGKLLDEQVRYGIMVKVRSKAPDTYGKDGYVTKAELKAHPNLYVEIP